MTELKWIDPKTIQAVHEYQLAEHGGLDGVRDAGLVQSSLVWPVSLAACGDPDAADLAAAYAYELAKTHGFADGNKRTARVAARLFLADNGCALRVTGAEAVHIMEALAAAAVDEPAVAEWFRG